MQAYIVTLLYLAIFMITAPVVIAKENNGNKSVIVTQLANISVGLNSSKDSDVTKEYGKGYFVKDEGHLGGRYFINQNRTITLHIEIGVDEIIELVELSKGLSLPPGVSTTTDQLISSRLAADPKIEKGLRLGMTPDELLKIIGTPSSDKQEEGKRIIQYQSESDNDPRVLLFYSATFVFVGNNLVKVSLYDGC